MSKKQYLYKLRLIERLVDKDGWRDEDSRIVEKHFNQLLKMKDDGVVILAGRTLNEDSSAFGIVIFNADNDVDAKRIMDSDPAIDEGIMIGELYPYHTAIISEKNNYDK